MIGAFVLSAVATLSIQTSTVSVIPPEQLPLGGYTERKGVVSLPGGDDLTSRCVIFTTPTTKVAMVSVETLTIPESLVREVKAKLPRDLTLILCATHTHCAPDSQMLNDRMTFSIPGIATYKRRWLDWYADRIASGVRLALGSVAFKPKELAMLQARVNLNRGRRIGAWPDDMATELVADGKVLLLSYAAHGTLFGSEENRTRGDWPGAVARSLDAPVFQGPIGDVSPMMDGGDAASRVGRFASALTHSFDTKVPVVIWRQNDPIKVVAEAIPVPKPVPHPDFAKDYGIPEVLAQAVVEKFAPKEAFVTAFRLGKLAIVATPAEPSSHLGRAIRNAGNGMGFAWTLVLSHANGWMGYVLDRDDRARGGYEATLGFYGPDFGQLLVDESVKALKGLLQSSK